MDKGLVRISKFLSLVLRHKPEAIGICLDRAGWVEVDVLLAAARRAGMAISEDTLHRVVLENDKQRFALSEDGRRIRANQGHSVAVDLGLAPLAPPERLYHGTATRLLPAIREQGLRPGRRTHVHLSPDERTATAVGKRHGVPIVLTVLAGRMHEQGLTFYRSANGVWLTAVVPPEYIVFPPYEDV